MSFRQGPKEAPLTKEKVLQLLKSDPYIEVLANA